MEQNYIKFKSVSKLIDFQKKEVKYKCFSWKNKNIKGRRKRIGREIDHKMALIHKYRMVRLGGT